MTAELKTRENTEKSLTLERARLDFLDPRTQIIVGFSIIATFAFIRFSALIFAPFCQSEMPFAHLILQGVEEPAPIRTWIQAAFNSCFAPGVHETIALPCAITFLFDRCLWHAHAWGYHVTNLLIFLSTCLTLALVNLEITGRHGNRIGAVPAIWTALLLCVYPANAALVSSIAARQASLNCLLAGIAIFALSRRFLLRETSYLVVGLVSGFLLLINAAPTIAFDPASFFSPNQSVLAVVNRLNELLFPVWHCEHKRIVVIALEIAYGIIAILALLKIILGITRRHVILLLAAMFVAVVVLAEPEAGASRSWANLYYGCLPLCLIISLTALPSLDAASRKFTQVLSGFGLIALLLLLISWSYLFDLNLHLIQQGASSLADAQAQISSLIRSTSGQEKLLFIGFPVNDRMAGKHVNLARLFPTDELLLRPLEGPPEHFQCFNNWDGFLNLATDDQLKRLLSTSKDVRTFVWNQPCRRFISWSQPGALHHCAAKFNEASSLSIAPLDIVHLGSGWHVIPQLKASVEGHRDFIRITPGASFASPPVKVVLAIPPINPLLADHLQIKMRIHSLESKEQIAEKCRFIWQTDNQPGRPAAEYTIALSDLDSSQASLFLGNRCDWLLHGAITKIGLQFAPGSYCVDLSEIDIGGGD
jgi:hypothetical protein